ncbi:small integral membrane protein 37 [Puma concolor]|nr:small integral membrane protein 37 [Puma concolor]
MSFFNMFTFIIKLAGQTREGEPEVVSFERRRRRARCARTTLRSARLTPPPRRRSGCTPPAAMANVSERTLQLSVLVAFASGVLVGWQANRLRRRYLDWRKRRLQDKLAVTQKKLDLA